MKVKFIFYRFGIGVTFIFEKVPLSILLTTIVLFLVFTSFVGRKDIRYFQEQTIKLDPYSTQTYEVPINDSVSKSDLLYGVESKEGLPIYFYRKIFTTVCLDNKCRALNIDLYWNITGRYLGFGLPEGEFLSKTDHVYFTEEEYKKLNQILAYVNSPLSHMGVEDIAPEPVAGIDAISTATPKNIAPYVIKDAAYTTIKLWHLIYGSTKLEVEKLTLKVMSPDLIVRIMDSSDLTDKIWALNHIDGYMGLTPELKNKIFQFIGGKDNILAEAALNSIGEDELVSDSVQAMLVKTLLKENYNIQLLIIEKMEDCAYLNDAVKKELVGNLGNFNGQVFKQALEVLKKQKLTFIMYYKIAELLHSDNKFISNSIADFLKKENIQDPKIQSMLKDYYSM